MQINIGYTTLKKIYSRLRECITSHMEGDIYRERLSGTIQMDEAMFTHREGPGRRGLRQVWIVGMIEERTSESYCFQLRNRSHATINRLILQYIEPHSLIIH